MTANELFHLYLESDKGIKQEKQLLERLRLVTLQELRRRSRGFRLTHEDGNDVLQESYFLLQEVIARDNKEKREGTPGVEDFEREFVLAIRRHLRHTYKYKKRETLYGEPTLFEDFYTTKPDLENYGRIISKLATSSEESAVLFYLVENRIKDKTCTLVQVAALNKISLDKAFKLERKLKIAIKKEEEK